MSGNDRPERTGGDGGEEKPACVALVPVVPTIQWSRVPHQPLSRADFVAQLIATAEQIPQTRCLRRGSPADAKAAYAAGSHEGPPPVAGVRTRQIV